MVKLTTKMELVMTTDTKKSALREKIEQFEEIEKLKETKYKN